VKGLLRAWWLPLAALAALWLPLLALWRQAWLAEPELAFGWGVPVFAIVIAWERSRRRPAAKPAGPIGRVMAWAAVIFGLLVYFAVLPILEANALWPFAQWTGAAAAGVVTLAGVGMLGGVPWICAFAFPVFFVTTALTWPTFVHLWIVDDLAGANAGIAAEFVSATGYPAVVNGNVIAVASGLVGIAEACSGLRSLQAVWMEAWFFGEFFRMNWPRRLALVVLALVAAMASNLARTVFLTWQAAANGIAASNRWHDFAADVELVVTLLLVAAIAALIGRKKAGSQIEETGEIPRLVRDDKGLIPSVRLWSCVVLAGALIATAGTEAWFFEHEREAKTIVHWELTAPSLDWQPIPLPERVQDVLQYSEAQGLTSRDPITGASVLAFLVSWHGDAANGENPEWHDPSICLPGSGAKLAAVLGEFTIPIGGVQVPFAGYRFIIAGRPFQVFFCHWDAELGRARGDAETAGFDVRERRLQRVREGRRGSDVAHMTLELQESTDAAAISWLKAWAPRLLVPHFSAHTLSF
jgi:exosortase